MKVDDINCNSSITILKLRVRTIFALKIFIEVLIVKTYVLLEGLCQLQSFKLCGNLLRKRQPYTC